MGVNAPVTVCNQKEPPDPTDVKFRKSISPWKSVEFVPPSVKTPPGSSVAADWSSTKRVMKKENSGVVRRLLSTRACQKGTALVLAMP
jgi:hypothetical protein